MKRIRSLVAGALLGLFALPLVVLSKPRPLGSLSGIVLDNVGAPIPGALLRLVDSRTVGQTLRSIRTSPRGEFYARNILPGTYRLRAEAKGFISDMQPVEVRPDVVLSLKFELRPVGRLLDARSDRDDYKWTVRNVPHPILRWKDEAARQTQVANDRSSPANEDHTHGVIQFIAGGWGDHIGSSAPIYAGVNFALSRQVSQDLEMLLAGQWSPDITAPQRLQMVASSHVSDEHKIAVVLGLGQFTGFAASNAVARERQISFRLSDTWQVAGPVVVLYGIDVMRFSGAANGTFASPRLGLRWSPGTGSNVDVELLPTNDESAGSAGFQSESAKVDFVDPNGVRSLAPGTRLRANQRLQIGIERLLSENSSIQAAIFFDDVSGKAVGLLAVPGGVSGELGSAFQELIEQGQTRGARVVYNARLSKFISGLIGYAFGQGHELAARGLEMPGRLLGTDNFHVVSFKLGGDLTPTHTTYAAYYRIASRGALFAVDPFYGRMDVVHPGLSFTVTQELPNFGFLPGRWEAGLDARNVLAQRDRLFEREGWNVVTGLGRSVRGSVSVRF